MMWELPTGSAGGTVPAPVVPERRTRMHSRLVRPSPPAKVRDRTCRQVVVHQPRRAIAPRPEWASEARTFRSHHRSQHAATDPVAEIPRR